MTKKVSKIMKIENRLFQSYLMKSHTEVYYRVIELVYCPSCKKLHPIGCEDFDDLSELNIILGCDDSNLIYNIRENAWLNIINVPYFGEINMN